MLDAVVSLYDYKKVVAKAGIEPATTLNCWGIVLATHRAPLPLPEQPGSSRLYSRRTAPVVVALR